MFLSQRGLKQTCTLLAVTCGRSSESQFEKDAQKESKYPFPELISSGRLEVRTLNNPEKEQVCKMLESFQPNIAYFQGKKLENGDVGPLVLPGTDFSNCEAVLELFSTTLPTAVYLDIPYGENLARALHFKGVPYVIYWKNTFSYYTASHFRHAFLSVVQSSPTHTWDAFQVARASFKIYCVQKNGDDTGNHVLVRDEIEPHLLGDHLKINVEPPELEEDEGQEGATGALSALKIHDEDVSLRFLVCGPPKNVDASLLRSLEDGLGALLTIEIRASKLQGKYSAAPPPLQEAAFSRGVITMRCDLLTSSSAHISLLVSGSAETCFDDELLENHIKNEIIERNRLVHLVLENEEYKCPFSEPRKSISIACGASIFEVCLKLPQWAFKVLRQLAPDVAYRSLVALGIASIQGLPVASFEKDDAERLLFFCERNGEFLSANGLAIDTAPSWFQPPPPTKKRCERSEDAINANHYNAATKDLNAAPPLAEGEGKKNRTPLVPVRQRVKVSAMRPIPRIHRLNMKPFSGIYDVVGYDSKQVKINLPIVAPIKHSTIGSASSTHQKSYSSSHSKHAIPLNPLPLKKHGCDRAPIQACSEEEFLRDVVQFLVLRGYTKLIPPGGLAEFPDAILNGTRLDLYNLYNEVVTRGGFHVGNGINWKGQIFSKMRNYTMTNRMTGVGNTLKRHYETYLLEYELAHDDVGGECCLLCHSSAPGDWVNCGICGEWAHFGCDRRQGLGAFKDYAKTDGLEYTCTHCSATNFRKKANTTANG